MGVCVWRRVGTKVEFKWIIDQPNESRFRVIVGVTEIYLNPSPEIMSSHMVAHGMGSGEKLVEFEEGHSYYVQFRFIRGDLKVSKNIADDVDDVYTTVSIPLSAETKEILEEFDAGDEVEDEVRQTLSNFSSIESTFATAFAEEVAKIKALNLPADQELERIEDLRDFTSLLREKMRVKI